MVKEGFKQTEVGEIPEDWEVVPLKEAVDFLDGKRRPVKMGDRAKMRGIYPYYGASGIVDFVNDYIFDDELILLGEDGENILSRNLPLAFKVSGKIWVNNHAHVLKPKNDFEIDFLCNFLESLDYSLLNSGTAQPKLNKQTCEKISVAKPRNEEQKEIAKALSDVDESIVSLEKLIAKKRDIKTATMQQLLTGKKRLPGFGEKWKKTTIGQFAPLQRGFDLPTRNLTLGAYPVVYSNGALNFHHEFMVRGPGVVTGRSGTIGKVHYIEEDFWPHNTALWVTKFIDSYPKFVFYLYTFVGFERFGSGSGVPTLNRNDAHSYELYVPNSVLEQQEIAKALTHIDHEIESLDARLDKTKAIKQGMMQELLTGRTRLVKPLPVIEEVQERKHGT